MDAITDHRTLLDALGGNTVVAGHLANDDDPCPPVRVGQWKLANSIPTEYWPDLIPLAHERGFTDITAEWLMTTSPKRKRLRTAEACAA